VQLGDFPQPGAWRGMVAVSYTGRGPMYSSEFAISVLAAN